MRASNATCRSGDLCDEIRASSAVITHAGAGSTLTRIQQGKFPIMVPRRAKDGEHVDDHQFPFTDKMCEIGYATAVREMSELPAAIRSVRGRTGRVRHPGAFLGIDGLARRFLGRLGPSECASAGSSDRGE